MISGVTIPNNSDHIIVNVDNKNNQHNKIEHPENSVFANQEFCFKPYLGQIVQRANTVLEVLQPKSNFWSKMTKGTQIVAGLGLAGIVPILVLKLTDILDPEAATIALSTLSPIELVSIVTWIFAKYKQISIGKEHHLADAIRDAVQKVNVSSKTIAEAQTRIAAQTERLGGVSSLFIDQQKARIELLKGEIASDEATLTQGIDVLSVTQMHILLSNINRCQTEIITLHQQIEEAKTAIEGDQKTVQGWLEDKATFDSSEMQGLLYCPIEMCEKFCKAFVQEIQSKNFPLTEVVGSILRQAIRNDRAEHLQFFFEQAWFKAAFNSDLAKFYLLQCAQDKRSLVCLDVLAKEACKQPTIHQGILGSGNLSAIRAIAGQFIDEINQKMETEKLSVDKALTAWLNAQMAQQLHPNPVELIAYLVIGVSEDTTLAGEKETLNGIKDYLTPKPVELQKLRDILKNIPAPKWNDDAPDQTMFQYMIAQGKNSRVPAYGKLAQLYAL